MVDQVLAVCVGRTTQYTPEAEISVLVSNIPQGLAQNSTQKNQAKSESKNLERLKWQLCKNEPSQIGQPVKNIR